MKKVCLQTHRLSWMTYLNHQSCELLRLCSHQGITIFFASSANPRQYLPFLVTGIITDFVCGSTQYRLSATAPWQATKKQKSSSLPKKALSHLSLLMLLLLTKAFWRTSSGDPLGMRNLWLLHMERRYCLTKVMCISHHRVSCHLAPRGSP